MIALRNAACLLGVGLALVVAATAHASPAPDQAESDCSWAEHGITVLIGGKEFRCLCAMLTGPAGKRVLCRLYEVDRLPNDPKPAPPKPKPAPKKKPPKKASPVLIHAPLPKVVG